jgi:hypothetical protein
MALKSEEEICQAKVTTGQASVCVCEGIIQAVGGRNVCVCKSLFYDAHNVLQ